MVKGNVLGLYLVWTRSLINLEDESLAMNNNDETPVGNPVKPGQNQLIDRFVQSEGGSTPESDQAMTQCETPPMKSADSTDIGSKQSPAKVETQPAAKAETHRNTDAPSHDDVTAETQIETPSSRTTKNTNSRVDVVASPRAHREIPPVLGDYELLEELGKGGMGVVFRARQRSMNRIVALKVIRPDRLANMAASSRQRAIERFRIEAAAAARISHDNLVAVYEVGCDAGCHYLSMRYVEGPSLSELVRKNPADNRQAANWIEPICRAVHAVHRQQVLHRDLKPQNILLDNATGRTLLTDFGLAKLAEDEDGMTQTGETMGTPAYMSPEQFRDAAHVTVAADVYSLGATLYCLLSGRPPFQASSGMQTMQQVLEVDALSLRQLNPAVDRDLETICMKCLEKEPLRRYASAELLADELKRYLDGRPILSRPLNVLERVLRWSRRNPLPAALIGVTFVAIVVAMAALGVSNVRTEAARKKSEESFQEAMSAVNDFFTRVSEERLLNEPGLQEVRHDLLKKARDYYEKFLKQRGDDPSLKSELAATQFRMGLILEELGTPEAALDWFVKARETQKSQAAAQPDSLEQTRTLSNTINAMGRASAKLGRLDDAAEHFREAERLREGLIAQTKNADDKFELIRLHANCGMNLGVIERQRQNLDEAKLRYEVAQTQREKALPQKPKDRAMRRDLAKGFHNLANLAIDRGDADAVRDNIGKAIELLEKLVQENARDLDDQYLLSLCYRLRGDQFADLIASDQQAFPAAQEDYSQALRGVQRLSDLNPSVQKYLRELVGLLVNLGQLDAQRERREEAIAHFRKAQAILQTLAQQSGPEADPATDALRKTVAAALQHFGAAP